MSNFKKPAKTDKRRFMDQPGDVVLHPARKADSDRSARSEVSKAVEAAKKPKPKP